MVFPHRQALRAWLLPFRYMDGNCLSRYSSRRIAGIKHVGDGRSKSGLRATLAKSMREGPDLGPDLILLFDGT
jgi:hypothetical protein